MIDGILLIDKPKNITSFDVIRKLRKITKIKKMGHSGTLDPFATGLMQICFNKATKIIRFLSSQKKTYQATLKLGIKTDTADITGKIIDTQPIPDLSDLNIQMITDKILSIESQIPPNYSAIKINGKRAFALARKKVDFEIPKRAVKIFDFEILRVINDEIHFQITVSKGTYIRTLSETLAEFIGTIGTTKELRRIKINEISVKDAVSLDNLDSDNWLEEVKSIEDILMDFPTITPSEEEIRRLKTGQRITCRFEDIDFVMINNLSHKCIGFAQIKDKVIQPRIIF